MTIVCVLPQPRERSGRLAGLWEIVDQLSTTPSTVAFLCAVQVRVDVIEAT
jgi:hypothetical protein